MAGKGTQVRVKARTQKVINMIVGKIQLETGKASNVDEAIWLAFSRAFPEITAQFEGVEGDEENGNGNGDREADPPGDVGDPPF